MGLQYVTGMTRTKGGETARRYFRSRACMRVDAMRLTGDGHRLMQLVTVRGEEFLAQALRERKGAILCSAHYGSVRACAGLLAAKGYPITFIAEWIFPRDRSPTSKTERLYQFSWKPMEHHFKRPNIVVAGGSLSVAVRAADLLRQNEFVFTLIDLAAGRKKAGRAVRPSFLGARVSMLPGPAAIARLTGAPLFMVFSRRTRDWSHLELEIRPRTPLHPDDLSTIQQCVSEVEKLVRSDPAQWELWRVRNLARLELYPEDRAREFYRNNGWKWDEL